MIYIDSRSGSKELYPLFPSGRAILTTLDAGDFMWFGWGREGKPVRVGVERKTIGDLLNSMTSGRLASVQAPKLVNSFHIVYLLIEGDYRNEREYLQWRNRPRERWQIDRRTYGGGYLYSSFSNFIATLQEQAGFRVWHTSDMEESVVWMLGRFSWWQKQWNEHSAMEQMHDVRTGSTFAPPTFLREVAARLPGIGWKKAKVIEEAFQSTYELACAKVEDISELTYIDSRGNSRRIGEVVAKKVLDAIHNNRQEGR